ncbi:MAG TPA: hypothetical protein VGS41_04000, partial [Chthonomonadales bacterium]|nr:hypothetical protein [Chthonomonadales bacterium]
VTGNCSGMVFPGKAYLDEISSKSVPQSWVPAAVETVETRSSAHCQYHSRIDCAAMWKFSLTQCRLLAILPERLRAG